MDDKTHTRRTKVHTYEREEIEPHDQKAADKALDGWIARNKGELNKSVRQGRAEQKRGKTIKVASKDRFVAEILADGRKRRAKRAKRPNG